MTLSVHLMKSPKFNASELGGFLPLPQSSFTLKVRHRVSVDSPASMLSLSVFPTTSFYLSKASISSATYFSRLAYRRFGFDYVPVGRQSPNVKVERLLKKKKIICDAASSNASSSSGDQADFNSFALLGRNFLLKDVQFVCAAVVTVLLASANRILHKMALVPLSKYPLFLAQFNTIIYVITYSTILFMRYQSGIVTKEMLSIPKARFILVGALEALGLAMSMVSASVLPGAIIPILTQVFLVWQLLLSSTILRRRYTFGQVGGCLLVFAGVVVVVASGSGGIGVDTLQQSGFFWPSVMIFSTFFFAASSILKELVFRDGAKQLKGGNLDLFVVNTFGSLFQSLFVSMILPLVFNFRGIPFHRVGQSLSEGYVCFVNYGSKISGCEGAPLVPLLYVVVNMSFNICSLSLLKNYSAIVSSLCSTLSIPLAIWAFTFPWPYLGVPPSLPSGFFLGAGILVAGLAIYSLSKPAEKKDHRDKV